MDGAARSESSPAPSPRWNWRTSVGPSWQVSAPSSGRRSGGVPSVAAPCCRPAPGSSSESPSRSPLRTVTSLREPLGKAVGQSVVPLCCSSEAGPGKETGLEASPQPGHTGASRPALPSEALPGEAAASRCLGVEAAGAFPNVSAEYAGLIMSMRVARSRSRSRSWSEMSLWRVSRCCIAGESSCSSKVWLSMPSRRFSK
mmetsp:Transcript_25999/g.53955  ORF Transcript_25999/g.53955 Transcript_25999/m.53955 type:complete len:200 (-) Transcript_25999:122-721(-)